MGKALKLITTDGNPALLKALKEAYPSLKMQGCIVHKLRSVATKLKRVHLKPCMAEAKGIFHAPSRREAIKRFEAWKEKWQVEEERAVRCLEKDLYHCLHYYSFPKEWWKKIRTTNILEREFREVRRRTRPMGFFPPRGKRPANLLWGYQRHSPERVSSSTYKVSRELDMTGKDWP